MLKEFTVAIISAILDWLEDILSSRSPRSPLSLCNPGGFVLKEFKVAVTSVIVEDLC